MYRAGRDNARAVVLPGGPPFTVAFFANEEMERLENYDSMEIVLFRADEIRRSLEADGWSESTGVDGSRAATSDQRPTTGD